MTSDAIAGGPIPSTISQLGDLQTGRRTSVSLQSNTKRPCTLRLPLLEAVWSCTAAPSNKSCYITAVTTTECGSKRPYLLLLLLSLHKPSPGTPTSNGLINFEYRLSAWEDSLVCSFLWPSRLSEPSIYTVVVVWRAHGYCYRQDGAADGPTPTTIAVAASCFGRVFLSHSISAIHTS